MSVFLQSVVLFLVALVIISEIYKMRFEGSQEAKDERGLQLIYKSKSLSYSVVTGGIVLGIILVKILKIASAEDFIFIVMITYFIQSIASSVFLYRTSRI